MRARTYACIDCDELFDCRSGHALRCPGCRKEETRAANVRKHEKHKDPGRAERERAEIDRLLREEGPYTQGLLTFGADVPLENYIDLIAAAFPADVRANYRPRTEFATRLPRGACVERATP